MLYPADNPFFSTNIFSVGSKKRHYASCRLIRAKYIAKLPYIRGELSVTDPFGCMAAHRLRNNFSNVL